MKQIDINQNVTTLYLGSMQNTRIQRVCGAMQISTIRDLCLCTAHDLANMRGMGCASLKKVKEVLGGCGLRLGMTEEEVKAYAQPDSRADESPEGQPAPGTMRTVDWEQRRYEVAKELLSSQSLPPVEAVKKADELIEALRKTDSPCRSLD